MVMLTFELKTVNWYCELWVRVTLDDNNNGYLHLWLILCCAHFLCYWIQLFFSIFPSVPQCTAWTPYGTMALIGSFGNKVESIISLLFRTCSLKMWKKRTVYLIGYFLVFLILKQLLTPGVTMIPACACKFVACLDPYVYAISHPRYRYAAPCVFTQ